MIRRFLARCGHTILPLLTALDLVACTCWLALLYPFGLADRPTGRELISGYVGRAASNGHRWGLLWERWIDWAALKLGDGPNHCRRVYLFWQALEPTSGR